MGMFINFDRDNYDDMWDEEPKTDVKICSHCNKKISKRQKWHFTVNLEKMSIDKMYHLKCYKELLKNG